MKSSIVPLMNKMSNLLSQYLQENGLNHAHASAYPVFFNRSRGKLTREGVAYIVAKYMDEAKKISPELFQKKCRPIVFGTVKQCICCSQVRI